MEKSLLSLIVFILIQLTSCEAFFTNNWFQGAADYSDISVAEAISSGDTAVMQELYDQVVIDAAATSGEAAAELYLQASELALGISGLSNPAILFEAPLLLAGGDGSIEDLFSILTETNLDLDALEDVSLMIASANSANPGSVPDDMWLFAAAGNGAAVVNDAEDAGQTVEDFLGSDPLNPVGGNDDARAAVQSLVNALDVLPEETALELLDNRADLEADGIVF